MLCLNTVTTGQALDTLPRVARPHLNFVSLVITDLERSLKFYTGALRLRERGRAMPNTEFFEVVLGFDNSPVTAGISLTYRQGVAEPRGNGSSSINLVVKDLAGILQRVSMLGGKITQPLQRASSAYATYSLARVEDPDGNALELVEYHHIVRRRP